jgi:soluble lytic murein transglycosylase-like protein
VHLRAKRPQLVNYWLGNAADYPRTFYGLIARRALGLDSYFDFESEPFTTRDAQTLQDYPAGRRALALLQVGQTARAEMEVRHLAKGAPPSVVPSLVALADRGGMPAVSLQLARQTGEGRRHDHAMFPMPRWEPKGGWMVDRALLFALMRQESEFLPHAESGAGARGLMQLMPSTAHAVAEAAGVALKDRKHVKGKPADKLLEPETNIALAQHYIGELMAHPGIRNNLLLLTAAYNSGPGTVAKWRSRAELKDDPLLFLELMPARETRVFVQRVLTNYWAYRTRLGQPAPELDALVEGRWPTYVSQDKLVVRNAAAR